jgi:hypothetical protein
MDKANHMTEHELDHVMTTVKSMHARLDTMDTIFDDVGSLLLKGVHAVENIIYGKPAMTRQKLMQLLVEDNMPCQKIRANDDAHTIYMADNRRNTCAVIMLGHDRFQLSRHGRVIEGYEDVSYGEMLKKLREIFR